MDAQSWILAFSEWFGTAKYMKQLYTGYDNNVLYIQTDIVWAKGRYFNVWTELATGQQIHSTRDEYI